MPAISRRRLLGAFAAGGAYALASAALGRVTAAQASADPLSVLWFNEPATIWQEHAFPIGNGSTGAMIFGTVDSEHIQFNHDTLWNGGPGSVDDGHQYNFGNWYEARSTALASVRNTIAATGKADTTSAMQLLGQTKWGYGAYQTFGDLYLDHPKLSGNFTNYRRDLDMSTGLASVSFTSGGVTYRREFFASYPDKVIVTRLTADQTGQVSFTARFATATNRTSTTTATAGGRMTLRGALTHNGMIFEAQVQVVATGGTVTATNNGTVTVTGADEAVLILGLGTDYANSYPAYRGADPKAAVTAAVDAAKAKTYPQLHDRHVADHSALFGRVQINLGQQASALPTDEALQVFRTARSAAKVTADPMLEMLHFQIGRYLLIGSSRAGSLPANLQGVWNNSTNPDWQSDYTTNINLEMNYWPSGVTNLPECVTPLVDFIDSLRAPGRVTATDMCGAGGFAAMSHVNVFGYTGVSTNAAAWAPESTAWLVRQLWEHYLFTQDKTYLTARAYPILKEHSEFWLDYLVEDPRDGTLVVSPSFSPEHGDFTAGCSYSQMIVWDLLTNTIAAAKIVGDTTHRAKLEPVLAKLDPGLRIGKWGQLQEWKTDIDDKTDGHRHTSHSYALFPGNQITAQGTPEFFEAARVMVEARTSYTAQNDIGWNRAQKINLFARLGNGDMAREQLDHLLWRNTFANFLNDWPFQIDGNFGVASGIAEMLVQSHTGAVVVLPALPTGWAAQGSFDGLRARGGFTVGATWKNGKATEIRVASAVGGTLRLATGGALAATPMAVTADRGAAPAVQVSGAELVLATTAKRCYRFVPAA